MPSAEEKSETRRYRLAQRRDAVGLTQDDLAHAVGRSRQTIGRWEAGTHDPSPRVRPVLARALRVSLDELGFILVPGHALSGAQQTFHTDGDRREDMRLGLVESAFVQRHGRYRGTLRCGDETIAVEDWWGLAEDHRAVW